MFTILESFFFWLLSGFAIISIFLAFYAKITELRDEKEAKKKGVELENKTVRQILQFLFLASGASMMFLADFLR